MTSLGTDRQRKLDEIREAPRFTEEDAAWLLEEVSRLSAELQQERARADWWDAETRRILKAVWAEGTDVTARVCRYAIEQRPANAQYPPAKSRDYTREERDDNSVAVLPGETT